MEVFGFSNYRDYLSFRIESDEEGRGYQKKLATAAGCQSSYLSQVLSTQANLTPEQAIGLSGFWNFDEDETEFFMKLVQYDRAGTPRLREHVLTKMEELRAKHRTLSNRFQDVTSIGDGIELEYYSTWYLPVIHTMVAVPEFRHAKAIARQLNLDVAVVENALETLARGSNSYRSHLWKRELQKLSNELKMEISVRHFPPGTSKWNKIEHRLFSFVSINWRGKPLRSYQVILQLIAATKTKSGLTVKACFDKRKYKKGIKVAKDVIDNLNIEKEKFHGEWNYSIAPR